MRFRTKKDSFIVESMSKAGSQFSNYSGGDVLSGWANNMEGGMEDENTKLPGEDLEGVDSDEWDASGDDAW